MQVIELKKLYPYDRVSETNSDPWKLVAKWIDANNVTEDVIVDFKGIDVLTPWNNAEFKKLLERDNVYFRSYNNSDMAINVNIICMLDGYKKDRIENIEKKTQPKLSAKEARQLKDAKALLKYFGDISDGKVVFQLNKYSQMLGNPNTIMSAGKCFEIYLEDNKVEHIDIDCSGMDIHESVLNSIAEVAEYTKNRYNISLDVIGLNPKLSSKLDLYYYKAKNSIYTAQERINVFRRNLKPNTPGVLLRYRKTKGLDDFGRMGHGEVATSRPAIFRRFVLINGEIKLEFSEYPLDYFYTKEHQISENDRIYRTRLHTETVRMSPMEVGLYDFFMGSKCHFNAPVQREKSENSSMYKIDEVKGTSYPVEYTMPERMKAVWDDYDIVYDVAELDKCIELTEQMLSKEG